MKMTTIRLGRLALALAIALLTGFGGIAAQASEILDHGKFFKPEVVAKVTSDLNRLESHSHLATVVETYETLPADKRDAFEKLATKAERDKFFHVWLQERAKAAHATGVFILISRDRKSVV